MATSDNDGGSLPWVFLDENLPTVVQVENIALESAATRPLFPPVNIHSLQGVRERLREFVRGNRYDAATEDTPDTQIPSLSSNQGDVLFTTLENLARRRQEIIDEIEQSRQRLALNGFSRPPQRINLSTMNSFSNPATAQDTLLILDHPDNTLAPLLLPGAIMPQQEYVFEERRSSLSGNGRIESHASFAPPSLTRQNAFVFPPHAHTIVGSGVTQQSDNFAFTPFSWPTQETAPHWEPNLMHSVTPPGWPNQERQQGFGLRVLTPNMTPSPPYHEGLDDFGANQNSPNMVLPTFEWPNLQDLAHLAPNPIRSSAQVASSNEQHHPFFVPQHGQVMPDASLIEQSDNIIQVPLMAEWQRATPSSPLGSGRQVNEVLEQETQTIEQGGQINANQIWSLLGSRTEELPESLDGLERHQAEVRSEMQELQMQRAELQAIFHSQTGNRAINQPENPHITLPPLPREPVDDRITNPDAPPTPGRRAPHIRLRRHLVNEASQDSHNPHEPEVVNTLHRVSRRRAETEPGVIVNHSDSDYEISNIFDRYSATVFFTPSPRQTFSRLTREGDNDLGAEPDRLLSHYRTQRVSSSQPFHYSSNTRSSRHVSSQWTDPDPRLQTERDLDATTSYLALMGCFTDSRAELHRIDDIASFISSVSNHSHRSRHSHPSSRHHLYPHHHSWITNSRILTSGEFRSVRRSILFRSAYGQRSGFRDRLDDTYGPIVGEWLWWVWLGATGGSEEDEEVGWVDLLGRRVMGGHEGEDGGVSGAGILGAGRWVERDGVGEFEIGIPGLNVEL
jgi:hypothetical protein